jgi:hypothetical protein
VAEGLWSFEGGVRLVVVVLACGEADLVVNTLLPGH